MCTYCVFFLPYKDVMLLKGESIVLIPLIPYTSIRSSKWSAL